MHTCYFSFPSQLLRLGANNRFLKINDPVYRTTDIQTQFKDIFLLTIFLESSINSANFSKVRDYFPGITMIHGFFVFIVSEHTKKAIITTCSEADNILKLQSRFIHVYNSALRVKSHKDKLK